ncbi:hypothetical protein [Streptomyces longispororuber]|uniref:hypothetical protein n=1 Tax=Streptomyces longispororuber TaxID=68230 RepID=UPI0036FA5E13
MSTSPTTVQWLRQAAVRVYTGSSRLAIHLGRRTVARARAVYPRLRDWLARSTGLKWWVKIAALASAAALARKIGTAVLGGIYLRIESGAWAPLLWIATAAWIIAAYRAGRPGWKPKERPAPESTGTKPSAADAAPAAEGPALPSLHDLRESLATVGTPHAHLAVLAADLGTTSERVREALLQHGVPVETVRMRGRGSSTGIKGDALPTRAPSPGGVVGAGQPANNDNNNAPVAPTQKGLRVERIGQGGRLITDPAETIRHHKVRGH